MPRRRLWIGAITALVVLVGGGWIVLASGLTNSHELERFGHGGMKNRFINLEDGSQLSVGSPDRHRIVVQWKDSDGHGWTAPKTVYEDKRNTSVDSTIRYGGSTVAIDEWFSFDTSSESDTDGVDVKIACVSAGHRCDVREDRNSTSSTAAVTSDGRTILWGVQNGAAITWTADGFHSAKEKVPAEFASQAPSASTVLAPDGSLLKLVGQEHGKTCTLTLLGSEPGSATFTTLTSVEKPFKDLYDTGCTIDMSAPSTDWVQVGAYSGSWDRFWWVRRGGDWRETHKDPSGLIPAPFYAPHCRFMVQTQFVNPDNFSYGSTNGRNIRVQVHRHGAARWTKPVILEPVAAGTSFRCASIEGQRVGRDGFVVALIGGRPAYGRALAVTQDQVHWKTAYFPGARGSLSVDKSDRVRLGDTVAWTSEDGFTKR